MRSYIDEIEKTLKAAPELSGTKIESYGNKYEIPEDLPYINIVPRAKRRTRQFVIGAPILYNASPEVEVHVWESSVEDLRTAFDACEELTEKVLDVLSNLTAANLGVDHHESEVEQYDGGQYETTYYYEAVIVVKGRKDESYT